eukprot:gene1351-2743_t
MAEAWVQGANLDCCGNGVTAALFDLQTKCGAVDPTTVAVVTPGEAGAAEVAPEAGVPARVAVPPPAHHAQTSQKSTIGSNIDTGAFLDARKKNYPTKAHRQYLEERRRQFPAAANIARKEQQAASLRARGVLLDDGEIRTVRLKRRAGLPAEYSAKALKHMAAMHGPDDRTRHLQRARGPANRHQAATSNRGAVGNRDSFLYGLMRDDLMNELTLVLQCFRMFALCDFFQDTSVDWLDMFSRAVKPPSLPVATAPAPSVSALATVAATATVAAPVPAGPSSEEDSSSEDLEPVQLLQTILPCPDVLDDII